jgi:hypothetical protein
MNPHTFIKVGDLYSNLLDTLNIDYGVLGFWGFGVLGFRV